MRTTAIKLLPVALVAAFISACADAPTSTVGFTPDLHVIAPDAPQLELVTLCKAGPAGTYTFDATATQPVVRDVSTNTNNLTNAQYTIVVSPGSMINVGGTDIPGACFEDDGHNHIALAGAAIPTTTVTVVESGMPADVNFDHVVVYENNAGTVSSSSSTTNSAAGRVGSNGAGGLFGSGIIFYNVAEVTGCTYTKGWYRNNGSETVVDVDGRTAAQAQAIFAATPGKPNGVTWEGGNNTLNLYQQLLAALLNRGSSASTGIAEVDQAIADAEAATGGSALNITLVSGTDVSGLIEILSAFNEGTYEGWPHCDD